MVCENHSVHRKAGQGCEPGHAGVQGKASQDEDKRVKEKKRFWWTHGTFLSFYRQVFTHKAEENNMFRNRMTLSLMPVLAVVFHLVCSPRSPKSGRGMGGFKC